MQPNPWQQPAYPPQQQQQFVAAQPPAYTHGVQQGLHHPGVHGGQPYQFAAQTQPNQQGVVVLGQIIPVPRNRLYRARAAKVLGSTQIVLAVLMCVFGIISIEANATGAWLALPIWSAVCFILPAGILGVVSGNPTNMQRCVITACMVMSILSALLAVTNIIMGIIFATQNGYYDDDYWTWIPFVPGVAYWSLIAVFGLIELVVSIVQSVFCCMGCCPRTTNETQFAPQVRFLPQPNPNMQLQQGQGHLQQQQFQLQQQQQLQLQQQQQQQLQLQQQQQQQQQCQQAQFITVQPQQQQQQEQTIPSYGAQNSIQSAPQGVMPAVENDDWKHDMSKAGAEVDLKSSVPQPAAQCADNAI